jgi:glycosyltransferase involved in cell wall biosynthesis
MISIVIPVYNEARIVREAAAALCRRLDALGWDYELILSENGSRDGTLQLLESLAAESPRVRFLHGEEPNYGKALRRGIEAARGEMVICDEIDLCDVAFYDRALPMLRAGLADMVVGSKRAPGSQDRRPAYRRLATALHNRLLALVLGFRGTDTHGVKAFVRERIAPTASRCVVDRDVFASELVLRAGLEGKVVTEIPVAIAERRPPSIALLRRVPNVLLKVAKLIWVLRFRAPARAGREATPQSK